MLYGRSRRELCIKRERCVLCESGEWESRGRYIWRGRGGVVNGRYGVGKGCLGVERRSGLLCRGRKLSGKGGDFSGEAYYMEEGVCSSCNAASAEQIAAVEKKQQWNCTADLEGISCTFGKNRRGNEVGNKTGELVGDTEGGAVVIGQSHDVC